VDKDDVESEESDEESKNSDQFMKPGQDSLDQPQIDNSLEEEKKEDKHNLTHDLVLDDM